MAGSSKGKGDAKKGESLSVLFIIRLMKNIVYEERKSHSSCTRIPFQKINKNKKLDILLFKN